MLKILGVGLPRTGTATLAKALEILGLRTIHHAPERIGLDGLAWDCFRGIFDDVDAVTDVPAALFHRPIGAAYPGLRYILTVRNVHDWYQSMLWHCGRIFASENTWHRRYTERLHEIAFGSNAPEAFLWQLRFEGWNESVKASISPGSLLVMDICGGDKWDRLCPFLGVEEPDAGLWPWENERGG